MKQIKVGLPDTTREYLEERARSNERSLSEEVRARIDQSVVDDRFDKAAQELGRDVMRLAQMSAEGIKWDTGGSWQEDLKHLQALKVAIDAWLDHVALTLNLKPNDRSKFDPVTLGKSIASSYVHLKPMLIKHRPGGDNMEEKR
jgi:Arc-like DNA binding domain